MSLFQESIIRKHLGYLDQAVVEQAYLRFKEVYSANKITNIKVAKEEQYQEGFIKDIFGAVLGYSVFPEQPFNIQTEKKNEGNSKKADGAIFSGDNVVGVIELKDNKTKNLDAVKDQAFGYKNNHKDCSYVISSNFHKLRFYLDDATDYEEFDLYNLDKETFKRFYLYLRKEGLLDKNIPKLLRQETKFHEENITKSLYKDYSSFKNSFFQNVVKNNPQYDKLLLFKKSQKFLDKVLFVLFAEDKGLVSTNAIVQIVEKWNDLKNDAFDTPKPLYHLVALFFNNLFVGKKDQKGGMLIPEFGGEIFAPDEVLDTLIVDDAVLQDDLLKLSKYDFNTDVDVNILGHIFEHSLSEIEEVEASLKGEVADKTKGKRKKDGVFYTPKYITKYIVENTVGKLCAEKKTELKIDIDIAIFELQKADGKLNAKGIELYETLNQYKDWLLTLKILDPACGSGAFLNQAVNFLIQEHTFVDDIIAELTNTPLRLFDTDIAILENNIYGVDINEESIEIAKLSLWLRTAKQGRKLSNLSNNIKCGNSLIDDPAVAGDKAFNWQTEFPEVFAKGGFDVVIGNPPYVRSRELFNDIEKDFYIKYYITSTYQLDLYKLFIEKSCSLINEKGRISLITPSVFLTNDYDKPLRIFLLENYHFELIVSSDKDIFEDASVKAVIFVIKKDNGKENYISFNKVNGQSISIEKSINQKLFIEQDYLINEKFNKSSVSIINKLKKLNKLKDFFIVKNGIKVRKELLFKTKINSNYKPFILGKNINAFVNTFEGLYINYLTENEKLYSNQAFRTADVFENEKLITRQILGKRIITSFDSVNFYSDQTTYLIHAKFDKIELKYLLALLNSKLIYYYFTNTFSDNKITFPKVKGSQLLELPYANSPEKSDLINLAELMINKLNMFSKTQLQFVQYLKSKFNVNFTNKKLESWYNLDFNGFLKELEKLNINLSLTDEVEWMNYFNTQKDTALELKTQITQTDKEIDQMVYALYELTEEEIKIVEES